MTTILVQNNSIAGIVAEAIYNSRYIYKLFKRKATIANNFDMYVFFNKDYKAWKDICGHINNKY